MQRHLPKGRSIFVAVAKLHLGISWGTILYGQGVHRLRLYLWKIPAACLFWSGYILCRCLSIMSLAFYILLTACHYYFSANRGIQCGRKFFMDWWNCFLSPQAGDWNYLLNKDKANNLQTPKVLVSLALEAKHFRFSLEDDILNVS